ncbi:YciI family protein [Nocardioides sp. SYSU D00038]|uniref:YciI family protein n=1 Tax=Nocardioides sp. SYSU D00038 TaxID=2812554 RepID=UPI00196704D6|nr:YciI family protein [Nocardioides sp. SYSU D00038]
MTQYMISVWHDPADEERMEAMTPEQMQQVFEDVDAFNAKLTEAGKWVFGGGLETKESTTCVDARGGDAVVTDGPYSEAKEYLGGFWVLELADMDEALRVAAEASKACAGKVEVRPFQAE